MTEDSASRDQPRRSRYQFQFNLASLFELTFLVACTLSVSIWVSREFWWFTAIPLGIIAILLLCTRWHCTIGTLIGFVSGIAVLFFVTACWIRSARANPDWLQDMVLVGSYGGAFGASIHAIVLKQRLLGGILLAVTIIVFFFSL